MILAIDIGNSFVKCAVFEQDTCLESFRFSNQYFFEKINEITLKYIKIHTFVMASVGKSMEIEFKKFEKNYTIYIINRNQKFPFQNLYQSKESLGIDRMVLVSGAAMQFPAQNILIIDAGTCITYDYLTQNNNYLGGAISPGFKLRYQAMHNFTANLPLLQLNENQFEIIGNSTQNAMHSGVINGIVLEIEGVINQFKNNYDNFIIILTGGDTIFLAKQLKNTIFANSNFLLESLNHLYQFQIKQ